MRRVARAVGITPMAIYRHYPSRAALLNAVAEDGFAELAASFDGKRFGGGPEARLAQMADAFLDHALRHPRLFELMFLQQRAGARRFPGDFEAGHSPTATLLAAAVAEGMTTGRFRRDDVWEITFALGALLQGLIVLYLGKRLDTTRAGFRALYRRSLSRHLKGLRA